MGQYKLWINNYYRRLTKHMRPTTITQTIDQQLIWDDLQSICIQQQYTNTVKTTYTMKRELDIVLIFLSPNFTSYF